MAIDNWKNAKERNGKRSSIIFLQKGPVFGENWGLTKPPGNKENERVASFNLKGTQIIQCVYLRKIIFKFSGKWISIQSASKQKNQR